MGQLLKWLAGMLILASLACLALASWTYARSEAYLRSFERPPPFQLPIPDDEVTRARGDHLVRTRGCRGCHGDDLNGQFMWGAASAPSLPQLARGSPADFEAALRHGIGADGRALYSMPSMGFLRLRDADVAAIIAYLRSEPVIDRELPRRSLPWAIRWDLARGQDMAMPAVMNRVPPLRLEGEDSPLSRGEYFAMTTCNECHGLTLQGDSAFGDEAAPSLAVVASYDETAFKQLLRTGKALGDRELPRMSRVARRRFATMTDAEIDDLYAFLRQGPARIATD